MAISDHTRKLLWGKSGNLCSMCRLELTMEENANDVHSIIGDECHIISKSANGPRYQGENAQDLDEYTNLILLCKNHHKEIDDLPDKYSVALLKALKRTHTEWIQQTLRSKSEAKTNNSSTVDYNATKDNTELLLLTQIRSGKEQMALVSNSEAFYSDYEETDSEEEIKLIASYIQSFKDWSDIASSLEVGERISATVSITKEIQQLENMGFLVFGKLLEEKYRVDKNKAITMSVAVMTVLKKDNEKIMANENGDIKGVFIIVPRWIKGFTA